MKAIPAAVWTAMRRAIGGVIWAAVYLLLTGSLSVSEIATSAALGVLVCTISRRFRNAGRRFGYPHGLLKQLMRAPRFLLAGVHRTARVVLRTALARGTGGTPGRSVSAGFESGADDPRDRARRACAVLLASLAPDTFVVRLDRGRDALLHTLVRPAAHRDPRWLT